MSILKRLTTPLWHEDPGYRRQRRLRQALTTPVMAIAGMLWGFMASPLDAQILNWAFGGAVAFGLAGWLYLHLQPALMSWTEQKLGRGGRLAGALLDMAVASGTIWLLTNRLGMPTFPGVTTAITLGGGYASFVAGFWDDWGSRAINGALGLIHGGGWGPPSPPFSHIESMLARGESDRALAALRTFVEDHPSDARGWLGLGRQIASGADADLDEAVFVLRSGIDNARMDLTVRRLYVAEIVTIRERQGEPHLAGRDLSILAELAHANAIGLWAQKELVRLRRLSDESAGALTPADVAPDGSMEPVPTESDPGPS